MTCDSTASLLSRAALDRVRHHVAQPHVAERDLNLGPSLGDAALNVPREQPADARELDRARQTRIATDESSLRPPQRRC